MTKKKAIEVATKFVDYLKELESCSQICTDEDIKSIEYLINICK